AGLPRPYEPHAKEKSQAASGAIVPGKAYLATFEKQGKKSFARLGALRVVMDESDAGKIARWLGPCAERRVGCNDHRGNKLTDLDLVPVRISRVENKKGSGKKAYVEIVEVAQLAQRPEIQGALVALDPQTGHLTAMVGGYDYDISQFNRATQAKRQ